MYHPNERNYNAGYSDDEKSEERERESKENRNNWKFLILKKFSSWRSFCIRDHYLYFFYK